MGRIANPQLVRHGLQIRASGGDDEDYASIGGSSMFLKLANNSYTTTTNSYTQFLCYLRNVPSIDNLNYIFNKDFITAKGQSDAVAYTKLFFQELMKKPQEQQQIFDAIWANNLGLKTDLWKPADYPNITESQAKIIFANWVSTLDDKIFKFIKVK